MLACDVLSKHETLSCIAEKYTLAKILFAYFTVYKLNLVAFNHTTWFEDLVLTFKFLLLFWYADIIRWNFCWYDDSSKSKSVIHWWIFFSLPR